MSGAATASRNFCPNVSIAEWRQLDKVPHEILKKTTLVSLAVGCGVVHTSDRRTYLTGTEKELGLSDRHNLTELRVIRGKTLKDARFGIGVNVFLILLTDDGCVYSMGHNEKGQLGCGVTASRPTLYHISALTDVAEIAAGVYHGLARTKSGKIFGWGWNYCGQILPDQEDFILHPTEFVASEGVTFKSIACGNVHSVVVTTDGQVLTFGGNDCGQLGADGERGMYTVKFLTEFPIKQVKASGNVSFALSESGSVFAWGSNPEGGLGLGHKQHPVKYPERVQGPKGAIVTSIRTNGDSTVVATVDGKCYHWGRYNDEWLTTPREFASDGTVGCPYDVLADGNSTNGCMNAEIQNKYDTQQAIIDVLETKHQELQRKYEDLRQKDGQKDETITSLQTVVQEIQNKYDTQQAIIDVLGTKHQDLQRNYEKLKQKDGQKDETINSLQTVVQDLTQRMAEMQEFIRERHDDTPDVANRVLRDVLAINAVSLHENLNVDPMFLADLQGQGECLTADMCEKIKVGATKSDKVDVFCDQIKVRGPSTLGKFLHALHVSQQDHVIDIILQRQKRKVNGVAQLFDILMKYNEPDVVDIVENRMKEIR